MNSWSNQGAQATAKNTHERVRLALFSDVSQVKGMTFKIFLQGSYKNDTNIRGDSDVDIVVSLNSTFYSNRNELTAQERELHEKAYKTATYQWKDFRKDVLTSLRKYYGSSIVSEGNKSIKIASGSNTINADVVVSCHYRKYRRFQSLSNMDCTEGIIFWTQPDNLEIISYPIVHSDRLVEKNKRAENRFKPTVRIFKNARTYMMEKRLIPMDSVPSYFIESLIYNAPNATFENNHRSTFFNILKWLSEVDYSNFKCPNGITNIFGNNYGQWNINSANQFVTQLIKMWNE